MPIYRKLFLFLLFLPLAGFCQNFTGGFGLGFTASQVHADLHGGYNKGGITAYTFVEKEVKDIEFGLGLRFIKKGSRMDAELRQNTGTDYEIDLSYVELPLYLVFDLYRNIELQAGTSIGFLLSQYEGDHNGEFSNFRPFNPLDLSANLQVNYLMSDNWKAFASWSYSYYSVREHAGGAKRFLNYGMLNNVLGFGLAYEFQ